MQDKPVLGVGCRSPPHNLNFQKNSDWRKTRMAYNHGREERKWRIWKEAEEKILRDCGVPESTIEEIRIYDRADFNSNRRFYRWTNDVAEYLEDMQDKQKPKEIATITDLLDEIENENLYRALLTVDKRTLQIVLLKMQGYSPKEIAPIVDLSVGAIYARLDHLRKKLRKIL
jgi:RNA polymerase sigma-70 factor (ECF subfamily)